MSVPYQNPISSVQLSTPQSVSRTSVFGTNFSVNNIGGYMEVYKLSDLSLTLTASTYPSLIQLSGNTIPIRFTKGDGTFLSPDYITLNSDNISSGRRRLGMMVYVHETDLVYQYVIPNYNTLWNNLTGLTGFSAITYSDYTTVINNRSSAGQTFINSWTASTIEGVSGHTSLDSNWRIFQTGGGGVFTGGTVTGPTYFTNGLTANTISATTYYNLPKDIYVTGGTYSSGTATFTNNSGGTFNITGLYTGGTDVYVTGATYSNNTFTYTNNTGGTFSVFFNTMTGLTATTISATTIITPGVTLNNNGLTATTISATTYQNLPISYWSLTGTNINNTNLGSVIVNNNSSGATDSSIAFQTLGYAGLNSGFAVSNIGNTFANYSYAKWFNVPNIGGGIQNYDGTVKFYTNNLSWVSNQPIYTPTISATTLQTPSVTADTTGLSATTISATTYLNLPIDVRVTGGTFNKGTSTLTFTNNTGGTFNVIGLTDTYSTGGTYSNGTITITNNTGGTFNITGLYTGGTDVYVTGGTYSNGTTIFTNNTGGTFNVTGYTTPFTGGTVTGATTFTGGLTANTISATTITSPSIKTYGLIVATSLGYQNIF